LPAPLLQWLIGGPYVPCASARFPIAPSETPRLPSASSIVAPAPSPRLPPRHAPAQHPQLPDSTPLNPASFVPPSEASSRPPAPTPGFVSPSTF
jgi:hypothetical protein